MPAHLGVDALGGADQMRRIAGTTAHDGLLERQAGDLLHLVHDLTHRGALASAHIEHIVLALVTVKILQCGDVRVGEIGDVNVVAHAGAVRSRVVVAEDRRCLALLETVEEHWDEVQDGRVFELDGAAAGDIEVAQSAEPNAVRLLTGTRHPFAEQLGLAVWVDRNHRFDVFGHHIDRRHAVGCGG